MGWLERLRKTMAGGAGLVGAAPSPEFASPLDLVHEALVRFQSSTAHDDGWLTVTVRDEGGGQIGMVQHRTGGLINLCDRDDIDLAALLRSAGRNDLSVRCEERDSAMFAIADATPEEIALAIDLVLTAAFEPPHGSIVEARIEA